MKKFFKFTLCLLICVVALGLVACGKNKKEDIDTSISPKGNGGMVVTAGDYIYYVNGYNSYETFDKSNLSGKFDVGGLYRVKMTNGQVSYDSNGSVQGAEKLSSNLVGFESTSLYVFGEYVYYVTPTTEVNKKGELQTSKLDFCRVSISGGKVQTIYQSSSDASDLDFEFYYADGSVYLLVNENGTLKRICCYGKFSVNEVDSEIKSLVLHRDEYDVFNSNTYSNIFYTKSEDSTIKIFNYNVAEDKIEYRVSTSYTECELMEVKFGHLYYKAKKADYPSYNYVYRMDATKNAITNLMEEKITNTEYDTFYFLDNETNGYIAQTSSKTYFIKYTAGGEGEATPIADTKLEIMAIKRGYIYFKSDNKIKRINYVNLPYDTTQEELVTIENLKTYGYDIDENNLYVYATSGSNTYLYSIKVDNVIEGDKFEAKLLGEYKSSDIPLTEE